VAESWRRTAANSAADQQAAAASAADQQQEASPPQGAPRRRRHKPNRQQRRRRRQQQQDAAFRCGDPEEPEQPLADLSAWPGFEPVEPRCQPLAERARPLPAEELFQASAERAQQLPTGAPVERAGQLPVTGGGAPCDQLDLPLMPDSFAQDVERQLVAEAYWKLRAPGVC
jgi:hypothetical protein